MFSLTINQSYHSHGLGLSGPCQVCKSEFLLNQYQESVSLELYGQFWNGESHAVLSNAVPEPAWWTDFIDTKFVSNEVVTNQVHQESRIASAGVSLEIPSAKEAGTSSIEATFQTTRQPFGFCQQSFGLNVPANSNIDLQQKALLACPDGTNSKVIRDSTPPIQSEWNPTTSSSALRFDCDLRDKTSRGFTTFPNKTFCQESQEKRKSQVPRLNPFKCPHCCKNVSSQRFRSHVQKCQEYIQHPNRCDACGKEFTLPKDVTRHQELGSCPNGPTPARTFACTCGRNYLRKDHLLRHINTMTGSSEDDKHLAVRVGLSN